MKRLAEGTTPGDRPRAVALFEGDIKHKEDAMANSEGTTPVDRPRTVALFEGDI